MNNDYVKVKGDGRVYYRDLTYETVILGISYVAEDGELCIAWSDDTVTLWNKTFKLWPGSLVIENP